MLYDHRRKAMSLEGYRGHSETVATPAHTGQSLNVSMPVRLIPPLVWEGFNRSWSRTRPSPSTTSDTLREAISLYQMTKISRVSKFGERSSLPSLPM